MPLPPAPSTLVQDGTVHSNACVARCLSRLRFECGDLTEKECARRCKRAARL